MKFFISLVFLSLTLVANEGLIKKAYEANMKPIPKSNKELKKLIDDPKNPITKDKVELGKILYFDPRLSKSNLISCNTCHNLGIGGTDGLAAAIGDNWQANPMHLNSPTVYNSALAYMQFYDGRSPHLADQAKGPMTTSFEMAIAPSELEQKIQKIKGYKKLFEKAYGKNTKITFDLIAQTIAIFEKTLITPSRFDDFMHGDTKALSQNEQKGLETFLAKGCANCHRNEALGGLMRYFDTRGKYTFRTVGGFEGNDNKLVKVPTLRNISRTAPYFHNGMVWNLKEAVFEMAKVQLSISMSDKEASEIVDFLHSLDGEIKSINYPMLPR